MDNLDDSENNAKVSDSAYSNSCSNSQSRRSHSSKSTHSGSNSSGSSGYGGKPSTSGSSNILNQPTEKRSKEKETKKRKLQIPVESHIKTECMPPEPVPVFEIPKEEPNDVVASASSTHVQTENALESMDITTGERISVKDDEIGTSATRNTALHVMSTPSTATLCPDGFSCVISMHDGVVMYTASSLTSTLGFPKEMWIGRSFIDFVHPKDRNTFASQITNGLAVPKNVNGTQEKVQSSGNSVSTMFCRIRRYRGLTTGFGVKDKVVTFMPFLLKLSFKNICDEEGKLIYLVLQATPLFSAFKIPNEVVLKSVPFVIRHIASGNLEYIDPASIPYLGYLPQDVMNKDALQLYHPDDLVYLKQVYETIVKEGSVPRCKPYRMMAQNGDYVKLETVWSSFINPWSKKLEFVIGKHYIIEGPVNPDVFQSTEPSKGGKNFEDGKKKAQTLRESIIRIMNEVLTKPAEMAKQQMSKRCQDLASFMESLMEEQPKIDDELRVEIHEQDNSYYERDSVMLGGISPHHDCNDSKSSTETSLSYNQLNYNENLQRYFNSHQPFSNEDYKTVTGENVLNLKNPKAFSNNCSSPMAQNFGDSGEMTSSCESSGVAVISCSPHVSFDDYHPVRLTEILLVKHNADMEKKLVKKHRETRSSSKGDREKTSNENRLKQKEHLARCNASFQPTISSAEPQSQGVKRTSKQLDTESISHKYHCSSSRQTRHRQVTSAAPVQPSSAITTTVAGQWSTTPVNNLNTFLPQIAMPQQMPIMNSVAAVPGMFPMYYVPTATASGSAMPTTSKGIGQDNSNNNHSSTGQYQRSAGMFPTYYVPTASAPTISTTSEDNSNNTYNNAGQYQSSAGMFPTYYVPTTTDPAMSTSERIGQDNSNNNYNNTGQYQNSAVQYMMYGQTVIGSPIVYTPINTPVPYAMLPQVMPTNTVAPLSLTSSNYEEACKPSLQLRPSKSYGGSIWRDKKRAGSQGTSSKAEQGSGISDSICSSSNALTRSTEAVTDTKIKALKVGNSEETMDRTDGESSYSSFYSSFFKTESGSADDSDDVKKVENKDNKNRFWNKPQNKEVTNYEECNANKKIARRKIEPPWMEQVSVTSELIYKYQVSTKGIDEVLSADKQKISNFEQPSLVNEQLRQLYADLQLEGVTARLTLEEGITSSGSSGSSGEETSPNVTKRSRRKREYSKLMMIYEEDAPFPSPEGVAGEEESSQNLNLS